MQLSPSLIPLIWSLVIISHLSHLNYLLIGPHPSNFYLPSILPQHPDDHLPASRFTLWWPSTVLKVKFRTDQRRPILIWHCSISNDVILHHHTCPSLLFEVITKYRRLWIYWYLWNLGCLRPRWSLGEAQPTVKTMQVSKMAQGIIVQ